MKNRRLLTSAMICVTLASLLLSTTFARSEPPVLQGIDRLLTEPYIQKIKGKKFAIVANSASLDRQGRSTVQLLQQVPQSQVVAIFTPEHGFNLSEDDKVADDRGAAVPIYSLYGPRKAPTADQLAGVDVIVFDLETVGLRYYTYITTLALVMKAAQQHNLEIIVLDRVNPLGGKQVSGALLNEKYQGNFAGYYPLPTRYGLTMGELARFYNQYFGIGAKLSVIPLKNWRRDALFVDTGLSWHAPSPALQTFEQAYLYALFGPFESLQLAVGRSQRNTEAFKRFGAPWMTEAEADVLVKRLQKLQLGGLDFKRVAWVPDRAKYQDQLCNGFEVKVIALKKIAMMRSFIEVAKVLHGQFPEKLRFAGMDGMVGDERYRQAIEAQQPTAEIIKQMNAGNAAFIRERKAILLY